MLYIHSHEKEMWTRLLTTRAPSRLMANYRSLLTKKSRGGNCFVHDWTAGVWITERWTHREIFTPTNVGSVLHRFFRVCVCCVARTVSLCIQQVKMRLHCKSLDGKTLRSLNSFISKCTNIFLSVVSLQVKNKKFCVLLTELPIDLSFSGWIWEIFRFWGNVLYTPVYNS